MVLTCGRGKEFVEGSFLELRRHQGESLESIFTGLAVGFPESLNGFNDPTLVRKALGRAAFTAD